MKITHLIVDKCLRLTLGGKTRVEITPNNNIQMIIGTNGSGKSSLLDLWTPLPQSINDFDKKGGLHEVHVQHKGNVYVCKSTFDKTGRYSFIKNGSEELNPGGTLTVQRDLCRTIFGITPELHNLLIGKVNFTQMPKQIRRHWITQFCPNDLAYAEKVFKEIKVAQRDLSANIKYVNKNLSEQTERKLTMEFEEGLEDKIKALGQDIQQLLLLAPNVKYESPERYHAKITKITEDLINTSNILLKKRFAKPTILNGVYTLTDCVSKYNANKEKLDSYLETIRSLEKEVMEIDDLISQGKILSPDQLNKMEETYNEYKVAVDDKLTKLNMSIDDINQYDVMYLKPIINNVVLGIRDISQGLGSLVHKDNEINIVNFLTQYSDKTKRYELAKETLEKLEHDLMHINKSDKTTCPSCNHTWVAGVTPEMVSSINHRIDRCKSFIQSYESTNDQENLRVLDYKQFLSLKDHYIHLMNGRLPPMLSKYTWTQFQSEHNAIVNEYNQFYHRLQPIQDVQQHLLKMESLKVSIESAKSSGDNEVSYMMTKYKNTKERIVELEKQFDSLRLMNQEVADFINYARLVVEFGEKTLPTYFETRKHLLTDSLDSAAATEIQKLVQLKTQALGLVQEKDRITKTIDRELKSLEKEVKRLSDQEEAAKLLAKALSPTEGIIAEQLYGAITAVVGGMNAIISKIWTYDLIIKPCSIEDGELDYTFPFTVETPDVIRSDVINGSSSMLSVFDFAFRVMAYKFFELDGFPLYLDELGADFDPEHRNRLMSFINTMVGTGLYSQVLIVSHLDNFFDYFGGSDIMALHTGNIKVPDGCNLTINIS